MAGGKQTPRQKMINLMYLVFIAMLALNMSKEVLSAFGLINERFTESNQNATERNAAFMAGLSEKAVEQPKQYKPLEEKAQMIGAASDELYSYLEGLKKGALENVEDPKKYETMDKGNYFDELFYKGGKLQPEGQAFIDHMNKYRNTVSSALGDDFPTLREEVESKFTTGDEKGKVKTADGVKKEWLNYHYVGFPLIASITKMTSIQSDVKNTQSQVLSAMLQGVQTSSLSMSNYQAIVVPDKTAFFSGENFTGKVVLGRFDNSLSFDEVTINGNKVESAQAGQIVLDFPAGNVGEQSIKGELNFKEGDSIVSIPIESSYAVIPKPNSAVISADKMNVVYRGVKNPMTISIPGVGSVSANAAGLSSAGGAGKYVMDVTNVKAREVKINVSGQLPGGETVSDSKTFRIKEIPRPVGTVRGEDGNGGPVRMQRNGLEISTISAKIPDFDFELGLNVSGFKMQVEGQPIVVVNGQKLNSQAKRALQGAKRGSIVQIFDIQAKIAGNSSYRLPAVSPVIVQLTN